MSNMYNWNGQKFFDPGLFAPVHSAPIVDGAEQQGFTNHAVGEAFQQRPFSEQNVSWTYNPQLQDTSTSLFNLDSALDDYCWMHPHLYPVAFKDCPLMDQNMQLNILLGEFTGAEQSLGIPSVGTGGTLGDSSAATEQMLSDSTFGFDNPLPTMTAPHPPLKGLGLQSTLQSPVVKKEVSSNSPDIEVFGEPCTKQSRLSSKAAHPAPREVNKSRAKRSATKKSSSSPSLKCEACEKIFSLNSSGHDGVHCPRCAKIIRKNRVGPPVFKFDGAISSFDQAWQSVYPWREPLCYEGKGMDDWNLFLDKEEEWIDRFIEYANVPYAETDVPGVAAGTRNKSDHVYYLKQQEVYNKKPYNDSSKDIFTNDEVNVRMRFLFQAVIRYHSGGHVVYPASGDNRGYGDDRTLKCSERLELVGCLMGTDKRILMNVIEGRGVLGFVANPKKYASRKTMNKSCNETKRQLMEQGETLAPQEAVRVRMERRMRKRKRTGTDTTPVGSPEPEGDEDGEESE